MDKDKNYFILNGEEPNLEIVKFINKEYSKPKLVINNVKKINSCAFYGARLKEIIVEEGVECIENEAFNGTFDLEYISLPSSVTYLGEKSFYFSGVKKIDFARDIKLTTIKKGTFEYSGLKSIIIPRSVKKIETNAFYECQNLKYVYIPKTCEIIEIDAFKKCPNLKGIYLEDKIKEGYFEEKETRLVKERVIVAGWDYHTHVGDPDTEIVEHEKTFVKSFKESFHKCYEFVSEEEFNSILANDK